MKLIMENWKRFLKEECTPRASFDTETGDRSPPVVAEAAAAPAAAAIPRPGADDFDVRKCSGDPECMKALQAAWNLWVNEDFAPAVSDFPKEIGGLLGTFLNAGIFQGQRISLGLPVRIQALESIAKLVGSRPSGAAAASGATATATGKPQSTAAPQDRLKAGLQKILSNPNIPAADKEEAKRDFEEEMRELAQG